MDLRRLKEQELLLSKEKADRLTGDPLENWEPTPKQVPFIRSVLKFEKRENWFIAANRSGKSDAGAYIGAKLARFGDPNARTQYYADGMEITDRATSGWVVALDHPVSRGTIQPKYFDNENVPPGATHKPFIPEREIKSFNKQEQILFLRNGSILEFKNCESGRAKFQGAEKDWIHFDEEPPYGIYEEATMRIGQRPLRIFGTCTLLPPEGVVGGVNWVFTDIVRRCEQGDLEGVAIFGASIYDNPHLLESEIRFLESKYPENSLGRRIRLNGEMLPGLSGARAYSNFDRALHVVQQPEYNKFYPLMWCWDFNVEPLATIVVQRDKNLYRVLRTIETNEEDMYWVCGQFKEFYKNHRGRVLVYGDSTGKNRNQQSKQSNYTVILNEMRNFGSPVELRVPESNPPVIDRVHAMNHILIDENDVVRMEIDPSNTSLITDLEGVLLDKDGKIKKTTNRKDPYFWRTHYTDALGYMVAYEEPIRPPANPMDDFTVVSAVRRPQYGRRR